MRLSEDKVKEVRESFNKLAEQQADMFCTTFEAFAQQLPSFVDEASAVEMFNTMLATVQTEYSRLIEDTKQSVNNKIADAEYIKELLKGVKHE